MSARKQLEELIQKLESKRAGALKELTEARAATKRLGDTVADLARRADHWEERAKLAVQSGDDELAKKALLARQRLLAERAQIEAEKNKQAAFAARVSAARKEFEQKLAQLKARKNTIARNLDAARSGGADDVFSAANESFEALKRMEIQVDEAALQSELDELLDRASGGDDARLERQTRELEADGALAELKKKMGLA